MSKIINYIFVLLLCVESLVYAAGGVLPGSGTESDPYLIEDLADFKEFADVSNFHKYWRSAHTRLETDLDLSAIGVYDRAVIGSPNMMVSVLPPNDDPNALTLPSSYSSYYGGVFDGGGHVISNLSITGWSYCGLFGDLKGIVKNLGLEDVSVKSSGKYCGALAGFSSSGLIEGCYSSGIVSGKENVGGLVGYTSGNNMSKGIINSYSVCSVMGLENVGGLVGSHSGGNITKSYAAGRVTGLENAGGLAGYFPILPEGAYSIQAMPVISNSYYYEYSGATDERETGEGSEVALSDSELTEQSSFAGFDFVGDDTDGTDDIWAIEEGCMPKLAWEADAGFEPLYLLDVDTVLAGSGTNDDPFIIADAEDLKEFAANGGLQFGFYRLANDIDLEGVDISLTSSSSVCDSYIQGDFYGTFDGDGYKISNMELGGCCGFFGSNYGVVKNITFDNLVMRSYYSSVTGGIAVVNNGIINNCHFDGSILYDNMADRRSVSALYCYTDPSVKGEIPYYITGGFVGQNYGYISSCSAAGGLDIYCYAYNHIEGGLAGENYGAIDRSYTGMAVSSMLGYEYDSVYGYSGGFVGRNTGDIENSYCTGLVASDYSAGGFAGLNTGYVKYCYSGGTVSGGEGVTGGFAAAIQDAGLIDLIITDDFVLGAAAGSGGVTVYPIGGIQKSFWDVDSSGIGESGDGSLGAIGKSSVEMVNIGTFLDAGWDFVDETENGYEQVWDIEDGTPFLAEIGNMGVQGLSYRFVLDKMTVKAGRSRGDNGDSISLKGSLFKIPAELFEGQVNFSIYAGSNMTVVHNQTIYLGTNEKQLYRVKNGASQYSFDLTTDTFQYIGKGLNLTGLEAPVTVVIETGTGCTASATGYDRGVLGSGGGVDVINGKKSMPVELMSGVEDVLTVDKVKFKAGKKAGTDSLSVQGQIVVADVSADIAAEDIVITYGDYSVTLEAENIVRQGEKKVFKYKSPKGSSGEKVSATIDLEKCKYSISVRKADIGEQGSEASFGIKFSEYEESIMLQ